MINGDDCTDDILTVEPDGMLLKSTENEDRCGIN